MTKLLASLSLAALAVVVLVAPASAIRPAEPPPDEAVEYVSPFRDTWQDEVRKDPVLRADIKDALRISVHEEESKAFTTNNRHVVIAYAVIWVLTVGFVVLVWARQRRLEGEIARLQAELARAAKE